jgi:hypothetical protein
MFDLSVSTNITLTNFAYYPDGPAFTYTIYYRVGTSVGHETGSAGWTLLSSGSMPSASVFSFIPLSNPFSLSLTPNQYGFYIETNETTGNFGLMAANVSEGTSQGSDGHVEFIAGDEVASGFGGINFSNKMFTGAAIYEIPPASRTSVTATVNALPTVSITPNSATVCAGSTATLTASGTVASYTWNTSATTASITASPTVTTNYIVTGTDVNSCTNTATSTVTVNTLPTIVVNTTTICTGATATLTANGATTYTWNTSTTGATITPSPTITTNYTVTGTDANNCSNIATSTITVNTLPTISVNSGAICNGQSFTMSPSGANTYTYSSGNAMVSPTTNSSYSVTGTSAQGCVSSNTAVSTVTVNPLPTISVNSGAICNGQSFTMTPSGANTYTYSSGSAVISPTITSSYSVTSTSTAGCLSSNTAISTVTVNTLPIISVNSGTICNGQSFTMTPSGANTYTFSSGSSVVSPTVNATYSVTGTSPAGCLSSNTAISTVTVNHIPGQPASINGNNFICTGTANTYSVASVTNATSYSWGLPNVWNGSSTTNVINSIAGTSGALSVTANNVCGNSVAQTANITVFGLPTVTANASPDSICNGSSSTITGSGANTYVWNNGNTNTSQSVSPTANTTYTVTGTDVNNCVNTGTVSVVVNQLPSLTYHQNPNAVCSNHSAFTLSTGFPTGGTYSGLGVTGNTFDPATAGTGTITITYSYTDANNCTNTITQTIIDTTCSTTSINQITGINNQLSIYPNPSNGRFTIETNSNINQTIQLYDVNGQMVLSQTINGKATTIDATSLNEGVYNISIISNEGVVNKRVVIVK